MSTKTDFVWVSSFSKSCFIKTNESSCVCVVDPKGTGDNHRFASDLRLEEIPKYQGAYGVFFPAEALI